MLEGWGKQDGQREGWSMAQLQRKTQPIPVAALEFGMVFYNGPELSGAMRPVFVSPHGPVIKCGLPLQRKHTLGQSSFLWLRASIRRTSAGSCQQPSCGEWGPQFWSRNLGDAATASRTSTKSQETWQLGWRKPYFVCNVRPSQTRSGSEGCPGMITSCICLPSPDQFFSAQWNASIGMPYPVFLHLHTSMWLIFWSVKPITLITYLTTANERPLPNDLRPSTTAAQISSLSLPLTSPSHTLGSRGTMTVTVLSYIQLHLWVSPHLCPHYLTSCSRCQIRFLLSLPLHSLTEQFRPKAIRWVQANSVRVDRSYSSLEQGVRSQADWGISSWCREGLAWHGVLEPKKKKRNVHMGR